MRRSPCQQPLGPRPIFQLWHADRTTRDKFWQRLQSLSSQSEGSKNKRNQCRQDGEKAGAWKLYSVHPSPLSGFWPSSSSIRTCQHAGRALQRVVCNPNPSTHTRVHRHKGAYICIHTAVCTYVSMYACMSVCMHVATLYIHIYTHVYMEVCTYVCMYAYMYECRYVCRCICIYIYIYIYVCVCACVCMQLVCMYVCMYVCIYIYIYIYINMYVYIYICICRIICIIDIHSCLDTLLLFSLESLFIRFCLRTSSTRRALGMHGFKRRVFQVLRLWGALHMSWGLMPFG